MDVRVYMDCSVSLIHVCVERQWMYGVYMDCSVSLIHVYVERQWMYGVYTVSYTHLTLSTNREV